jgi:integrase/recombinase XerD
MTSFTEHLDAYLRLRRALGFKLVEHERLLRMFVAHLDATEAETITIGIALGWATARDLPIDSSVPGMRLLVIRGFAGYLIGIDPRTEIPPSDLITVRKQRRQPYIYTDAEIVALMDQARAAIRQRLVASTYVTLIGLIASTGMRIGEAINLDRADVDWSAGVLAVRRAKFDKSRLVPVHGTTLAALDEYASVRDSLCPRPLEDSFFVSLRRKRLEGCAVHATFRRICSGTGVGAGAPFPPRIHDLRHTLAVRTLLGWYREGVDVHAQLPVLSTYLGHVNPVYTYYYLSAAPELLAHAAGMVDAGQQVLS